MKKAFDGKFSDKQKQALHRVLGNGHLSSVVDLAGASKSMMLATANSPSPLTETKTAPPA